MHKRYKAVFNKRFASLLPSSQDKALRFLRALPEPDDLTQEFVRKWFRKLSPATQQTYASYLRTVGEELNRDLLALVKLPKVPEAVKQSDLYTKKELELIWKACTDTRDKAMFQVLYEGAFRAKELVNLKVEDIRPDKRLWWLSVVGKGAKPRTVPIVHSIPSLSLWLEAHPSGKGRLFVSLKNPEEPLEYSGLYRRLLRVLRLAKVRVRDRPLHLFRHTRLTELAGMGLTESEMCAFAGWHIGSSQTRVYVHMSGRDLKRSFGRIYGLEVQEEEPALKMEARVCPRCKRKNPPESRFCSQCSLVLDDSLALRLQPDTSPLGQETVRALIRELILEELAGGRPEDQEP